tara:strand:- start:89 stop:442 length:354 start_codon:yes stop_codon:yes gene_type:complete
MNKVKQLKRTIENSSRIIDINNIEYNKKDQIISILRVILFGVILEIVIVGGYIVTGKVKILFLGTILLSIILGIYIIYLALNPVDSSIHYNATQLSKVTGREIQQKIADLLLPNTCG